MDRKISLLMLVGAMFLLCACMPKEPQTDYPRLETGINLTQAQIEAQYQYDELMMFVDPEMQAWLETTVKPLLLDSQRMIYLYNQAVLRDEPPEYTERQIRRVLREISHRLLEARNVN